MKERIETFKRRLEAAAGKRKADLLLMNVRLVDVYTEEIRPASIAVYDGRIVAIDPAPGTEAERVIDGGGMYAVPGFMDAHVHVETTLLTPEALAEVIVPWGTTTLMVDAMEIANVAGEEGLLAMVEGAEKLPFRMFLEIPSRVPTAPGLETTGGVLGPKEVRSLLERNESVSLGELDPSKVLDLKDEYLEKILTALDNGKICNGHAIGLGPLELNMYASAHLTDDHECVTFEELRDRLRTGISVFIREGSSERNAKRLLAGVAEHRLPTENLMFCTDDKHVQDIAAEGHIGYNVKLAVEAGIDPVKAIRMATLNTAKHFRMEEHLGSLTPGRLADILLLPDLKEMRPAMVIKDGMVVAENGRAVPVPAKDYPARLFDTVHVSETISEESFTVTSEGKRARCRVIDLIPDQIINNAAEAWFDVCGGKIAADPARDLLKLSVVERYGKNGRVSTAFVRGFRLERGALAASVSHDHHNIVVVGTNERDMLLAVRELQRLHGGFAAAADGEIKASVALPLAGLMSPEPAATVMAQMETANAAVRALGCPMSAPFMTLSFISLPTVPELGLTDVGLIDVLAHTTCPLVLETEE
ncbi:MAG: adenine deaminase [Clostridia bacterium]|nr:adenine deaminase [Clostridia bacterium]